MYSTKWRYPPLTSWWKSDVHMAIHRRMKARRLPTYFNVSLNTPGDHWVHKGYPSMFSLNTHLSVMSFCACLIFQPVVHDGIERTFRCT